MESLQQLIPSENKEIAKLCATAADNDSFKVYSHTREAACGEIILILDDLEEGVLDMSRESIQALLREISTDCNNYPLYGVCVIVYHPYHLISLVEYGDDTAEITNTDALLNGDDQSCICIGSMSISPLPGKAPTEPKPEVKPEPKAKTPLESLLFL